MVIFVSIEPLQWERGLWEGIRELKNQSEFLRDQNCITF